MSRWIKLHEKITQWQWYTDPATCHLFLHLLVKANYCTGYRQGVEIGRGQYLTSIRILSVETGLSVRQVRTSLKRLFSTQEVTQEMTRGVTQQFSLLTIVNYDFYQSRNNDSDTESDTESDAQNDTQATQQRHSNDTALKNNKNINNSKKEKNYPPYPPFEFAGSGDQEFDDNSRELAIESEPITLANFFAGYTRSQKIEKVAEFAAASDDRREAIAHRTPEEWVENWPEYLETISPWFHGVEIGIMADMP